jgi:hypothetical protein
MNHVKWKSGENHLKIAAKWSEAKRSEVKWSEIRWREVNYGEEMRVTQV